MNPPYGRDMGKWVRKAYEESQRGALVVCLVPARTDVAWWHDWAMHKAEITLLRGRMKFHTWHGELLDNPCKSVREGRHAPTNHAPFATAVLVYRPNKVLCVSARNLTSATRRQASGNAEDKQR
jgi:hypothetical protein